MNRGSGVRTYSRAFRNFYVDWRRSYHMALLYCHVWHVQRCAIAGGYGFNSVNLGSNYRWVSEFRPLKISWCDRPASHPCRQWPHNGSASTSPRLFHSPKLGHTHTIQSHHRIDYDCAMLILTPVNMYGLRLLPGLEAVMFHFQVRASSSCSSHCGSFASAPRPKSFSSPSRITRDGAPSDLLVPLAFAGRPLCSSNTTRRAILGKIWKTLPRCCQLP